MWFYRSWRLLYTALLGLLTWDFLSGPGRNELGSELGYIFLLLGVVPSLVVLALTWIRPKLTWKVVQVLGILIVIASVVVGAAAPNFMWLIVAVPLFTWVIEAFGVWVRNSFRHGVEP